MILGAYDRTRATRMRQSGGEWRPTQLPGCALWLRADLGVTLNGSTVSAWANQGTAGGSATQGTAAWQPTWTATGFGAASRPYFSCDGGDFLSSTTSLVSAGAACTIFAACQHTGAAGGGVMSVRTTNKHLGVLEYVSAGVHYASGNGVDAPQNIILSAGSLTGITSSHIARWSFGDAGQTVTYARDGALKTTSSGTRAAETGTVGYFICAAPAIFTTGKIAEIIVFNRTLTAQEIAAVERYMGAYHGITVS